MNAESFVLARRPRWLELENGLAVCDRGRLHGLSASQIERLALLYRHAASDLALARREFPDAPITEYLNGLCGRAHVILHRGEPLRMRSVRRFFVSGVPQQFRAYRWYVLASLGVMVIGIVAGWLAYDLRPDLHSVLVPHSAFDEMAKGQAPDIGPPGVTAIRIFLHNIQVGLIMFILGIALGLPTAVLLFENGWILGTLGAAVHAGGYDFGFWSLIVAHGILELSIITIMGAAGLRLGDAVLRPGQRTRGQSLAEAANGIIGMVCGIVILLVVAGITEGFISPSDLPPWFKIAWGLTLGTLFYGWLLLGGRRSAPAPMPFSLERTGPEVPLPMRSLPTAGD